jgi:hypothetical protein
VPSPLGGDIAVFDSFGIAGFASDALMCKLKNTSPASDYAVLVDGQVALREGSLVALLGFSANTTFGNFFDIKYNASGEVLLNCVVNDPAIPGAPDSAMLRINAGSGSSTTLAKEGDVLPGNPGRTISYFSNQPEDTAFNNLGEAMFIANLTGDGASNQALCLAGNQGLLLLAQEGGPAAGGGTYRYFAQSGLGFNDSGQFVFQATRQDWSSVLVTHAGLFIAEGDPLPGKPGQVLFDLGTFAPAEIDAAGRVLWIGTWGGINGPSGLFLDHQLAVEAAVTSVDGVRVTSIDMGSNAYHISPNGEWIIVQVTTAPGGKQAAILVHVE